MFKRLAIRYLSSFSLYKLTPPRGVLGFWGFVVGPLTGIAIQLACLLLEFGDITTSLHSGGNKVSDNKVIPFPLKGRPGRMFETEPCIPSYKQYGALPLYTLL